MIAPLDGAVAVLPFADQGHHRMRCLRLEFRAVGAGQTRLVARVLDDGKLHPQADAQVGNAVLARMPDRADLALDPALAEAARDQDRVHAVETVDAVALDRFRIDVMDLHLAAGVDSGVRQRFGQ